MDRHVDREVVRNKVRRSVAGLVARLVAIFLFVLIAVAGFGQAVLQLWNWLMPALFGAFGPVYLAAAAILGARLLWYCLRLLREQGPTGTPWRMYRFSLLYLALLFVAMGVDRALPIRSPLERPELIVLDRPDVAAAASDDHSHHAP